MTKYRFDPANPGTIQRWKSSKKGGRWENWKYYRSIEDAVRHCLLHEEIFPIGDELREQLENLPEALDSATQRVIDSLGSDNA